MLAIDSRVQWGFLKQRQAERRNDASKIKVPGSLSQRKWNVTEGLRGKRWTQWSVHSSFSPLKNNYICSNMKFWFTACSKQKETLMFPITTLWVTQHYVIVQSIMYFTLQLAFGDFLRSFNLNSGWKSYSK